MYLSIGNKNSAWYHRNIEGSELTTYHLYLVLLWTFDDELTVCSY